MNAGAAKKANKGESNYTITGLEAGYYLVKDKDESLKGTEEKGSEDAYTRFILKVVGDVAVDPKSSAPSLDKQVLDVNDSEDKAGTWGETADHDIDDVVSFRLIGTLPSTYDDYSSYKLVFHDTMDAALKLDEGSITVDVYEDANLSSKKSITLEKGKDYEVVTPTDDGCTFHVVFKNLKAENGSSIKAGNAIVVNYEATLTDTAKVGKDGNWNGAKLEFSNNPNYTGDGENPPTGETPEDKVVVFTYELDVNKVNENKQPKEGAQFKLYKKNKSGDWVLVQFTEKDGKYYVDQDGSVETLEGKGEKSNEFNIVGLDDGEYKLVETKAPDGYNKGADIEFSITATHIDDPEHLENVVFDKDDTKPEEKPNDRITDGTGDNIGKGTAEVVNMPGSDLPSTGGIGTTIFYIVGGLMVLVAGVLLITKRRMNRES